MQIAAEFDIARNPGATGFGHSELVHNASSERKDHATGGQA
jgi:hypothetical protein